MIERQDSWKDSDDSLLASTVLEHIRRGSTQLQAFEEAAGNLERSSAACGFRWNSSLRKEYENEIAAAKKERFNAKEKHLSPRLSISKLIESEPVRNHPLFAAIKVIHSYVANEDNQHPDLESDKIAELTEIIANQNKEIQFLQQRLLEAKEAEIGITEDYQTLLRILDRARSMGVLQAEKVAEKAMFKMDANGNLERIG